MLLFLPQTLKKLLDVGHHPHLSLSSKWKSLGTLSIFLASPLCSSGNLLRRKRKEKQGGGEKRKEQQQSKQTKDLTGSRDFLLIYGLWTICPCTKLSDLAFPILEGGPACLGGLWARGSRNLDLAGSSSRSSALAGQGSLLGVMRTRSRLTRPRSSPSGQHPCFLTGVKPHCH